MTMPFGCGISISAFEDLYKDETFASYSQVSLRFNRTKGHLFRYLQICYFVRKNFKDLLLLPAKTLKIIYWRSVSTFLCLYDLITERETDLDFRDKTFEAEIIPPQSAPATAFTFWKSI